MNIPMDAILNQHTSVLGKTGSGKSSVMRLFVEHLLTNQLPVCIIDPKGDWWGLKSSADGKHAGFPVVIFGGEHADVPLNQHAGKAVAELMTSGNRPCIIDLGGWMVGDRTRFFVDFASTLFRTTQGKRWLVLDEVHNFAPQGKVMDPDAGKMLHWANRLASEGRGKGLKLLSASQRPQKVHKDFLTCSETLIAMRVIHNLDRDAVRAWVDGCADKAKGVEVIASLAQMKRGDGWVWSPEAGFGPTRIQFPMFKTYDSFKEPDGDERVAITGWASVDLDEVKARLADVVKEAEANDPKALKAEVARLNRALADAQKQQPTVAVDPAEREQIIKAAKDEAMRSVRPIIKQFTESAGAVDSRIANAAEAVKSLHSCIASFNSLLDSIPFAAMPVGKHARIIPKIIPAHQRRIIARTSHASPQTIPIGQRKILTACAQYPNGLAREQLTVLCQYKRSSRDTYIQRLKEKGYLELSGSIVLATQAGVDALGDFEPLPTGVALQEHWLAILPIGERAILERLIAEYPSDVSRDDLSNATGYQRSSRDAYIQRMKAKQLVDITGPGCVRASSDLF